MANHTLDALPTLSQYPIPGTVVTAHRRHDMKRILRGATDADCMLSSVETDLVVRQLYVETQLAVAEVREYADFDRVDAAAVVQLQGTFEHLEDKLLSIRHRRGHLTGLINHAEHAIVRYEAEVRSPVMEPFRHRIATAVKRCDDHQGPSWIRTKNQFRAFNQRHGLRPFREAQDAILERRERRWSPSYDIDGRLNVPAQPHVQAPPMLSCHWTLPGFPRPPAVTRQPSPPPQRPEQTQPCQFPQEQPPYVVQGPSLPAVSSSTITSPRESSSRPTGSAHHPVQSSQSSSLKHERDCEDDDSQPSKSRLRTHVGGPQEGSVSEGPKVKPEPKDE
jgi:hypothetical protein